MKYSICRAAARHVHPDAAYPKPSQHDVLTWEDCYGGTFHTSSPQMSDAPTLLQDLKLLASMTMAIKHLHARVFLATQRSPSGDYLEVYFTNAGWECQFCLSSGSHEVAACEKDFWDRWGEASLLWIGFCDCHKGRRFPMGCLEARHPSCNC